jgi:hypothetical protein
MRGNSLPFLEQFLAIHFQCGHPCMPWTQPARHNLPSTIVRASFDALAKRRHYQTNSARNWACTSDMSCTSWFARKDVMPDQQAVSTGSLRATNSDILRCSTCS